MKRRLRDTTPAVECADRSPLEQSLATKLSHYNNCFSGARDRCDGDRATMDNTLFIFVDESGNPNRSKDRDDYFTVAGCWCVSTRSDPSQVLSPTKNRLVEMVRDDFGKISEIKGSQLPPRLIDNLIPAINDFSWNDSTIVTSSGCPWDMSLPIRYSTHNINPKMAAQALGTRLNTSLSDGQLIRVISLLPLINPLCYTSVVDVTKVEGVKVILDSEVWSHPSRIIEEVTNSNLDLLDHAEFETGDSKGIPGLQLADLAAYSWARCIRKGDCVKARNCVSSHSFRE